jgi:hypothetical protein
MKATGSSPGYENIIYKQTMSKANYLITLVITVKFLSVPLQSRKFPKIQKIITHWHLVRPHWIQVSNPFIYLRVVYKHEGLRIYLIKSWIWGVPNLNNKHKYLAKPRLSAGIPEHRTSRIMIGRLWQGIYENMTRSKGRRIEILHRHRRNQPAWNINTMLYQPPLRQQLHCPPQFFFNPLVQGFA